jgi:DNA-binding response OmpR family regulator
MALILVVEDDEQVRNLFKRTFEAAGYDVVEASNGDEGIQRYREHLADLIVTDVVMPGKEGIQMIVELRSEFPDVKIIAVSGGGIVSSPSYLVVAKNLGANRTLAKPVALEVLLATVSEVLAETV